MHKALWVVTRKTNLSAYHKWLELCPDDAAAMGCEPVPDKHIIEVPSKQINPESGTLDDVSTKDFIDRLVQSYCLGVVQGKMTVDGIVFDEFNVFVKRVYEELSTANTNAYRAIALIKKWVGDMCEIPLATDKPMCMVCHAVDPKYDEDTNKLKYPGGPAMPIGTMIAELCSLPDAVLQLDVVETGLSGDVKHVLRTQTHPEWIRKCRLWGVDPEIEPDLLKLLRQGGWE